MKAINKLRVKWNKKEHDLLAHYPRGKNTKSDAHFLVGVFDQEFIDELRKRGYDITTMKFSVEPVKGYKKFSPQ
jgi:hypothetical protein